MRFFKFHRTLNGFVLQFYPYNQHGHNFRFVVGIHFGKPFFRDIKAMVGKK